MKTVITVGVVAAALALFAQALSTGLSRQEVVDCNTWAQEARDYPSQFFLLKWQKEQCDSVGIIINASIK